jgi:hypothetical protein
MKSGPLYYEWPDPIYNDIITIHLLTSYLRKSVSDLMMKVLKKMYPGIV